MQTENAIDKASFEKQGYGIARSVFSRDEVASLRADVYKQLETDQKKGLVYQVPPFKAQFVNGDLLSKELLYRVLLDDRILSIAQSALGAKDLVYFGDSSYQTGTGSNGFHRDNIDRSDLNAPDWQGKYTLLRLGIYLQDHSNFSGGLKIRTGSHRASTGKAVFVNSKVGDVVFWDLKTLHSGNAVRLKAMPDFSVNVAIAERLIPGFLRKEEEQERISMFMTFAVKSAHLHRYLTEYTLKRKDTIDHAKASVRSAEAIALAAQKNVRVIDPLTDSAFIEECRSMSR